MIPVFAMHSSPLGATQRLGLHYKLRTQPGYTPVPSWLGRVASLKGFRLPWAAQQPITAWALRYGFLPEGLHEDAKALAALAPGVDFNVAFAQRYPRGAFLFTHQDPCSNLECTIIQPLGLWEGGELVVEGTALNLDSSQSVVLRCYNGNAGSRPRHSLQPVTAGERWALILNRVV